MILAYLGEHDRAYVTQMQRDLGVSYDTIYRARSKLDEYNLIEIDTGEGGRGSKNWFYLNPKGKNVLNLIKKIDSLIET